MAPTLHDAAALLQKRYDYCYDDFGYRYRCNYSNWDHWGRWVALVVIIFAVLIVAFLCSCMNARRRRKRGIAPMYGTGWMPYTGNNKHNNNYNNGNNNYYPNQPYGGPAPPYPGGPANNIPNQQTGTTFQSGDGYYGQNNYGQQGVELQPPQNTYHSPRGGDPVYEAPQGPPPGKGDHVVR